MLRRSLVGCADEDWTVPHWLLPHQRDPARRLAAALTVFHGALLADQVGLGKTYIALALATRYRSTVALVPAVLSSQWSRVAGELGVPISVLSHEALSRGTPIPTAPLIVVDEAHRFRRPGTRRYDRLCRTVLQRDILLVTATPVVNRAADLIHLIRLFLADNALAPLGVRSLEEALADPDTGPLMHAALTFTVGRSHETANLRGAMPITHDVEPVVAGSLDRNALPQAVAALDKLRFPSFGREAARLLEQHAFYRLASSSIACHTTLRRHSRYLDRAMRAAARGERLSRRDARRLLAVTDQDQLSLDLAFHGARRAVPLERLELEKRAVERAMTHVHGNARNPKLEHLRNLLVSRQARKTVVFTAAKATAHEIAHACGWKAVALVTGGSARLASGPIAVDEALGLFAPRARGRAAPPARLAVDVLIATDFASEGLDLQDADGVVHYDLPWTPLRLEQRVGRVARLGTMHDRVCVWWFLPPQILEDRLRISDRIGRKMRGQLRLAVPRTSRVGRGGVTGSLVDVRERMILGPRRGEHGFAVVAGPPACVASLAWDTGNGIVRELVGCDGMIGLRTGWERIIQRDVRTGIPFPLCAKDALTDLLRRRRVLAETNPVHTTARQLRRLLVRRAAEAGRQRAYGQLDALDRTLRRVNGGVPVGAERKLSEILQNGRITNRLRRWLASTRPRARSWTGPAVEAVVAAAR